MESLNDIISAKIADEFCAHTPEQEIDVFFDLAEDPAVVYVYAVTLITVIKGVYDTETGHQPYTVEVFVCTYVIDNEKNEYHLPTTELEEIIKKRIQ